MADHEGGCLCGGIRYKTTGDPVRVTMCHCRFCQRATGAAYMVEPIFRCADVRVIKGSPVTYDIQSKGSGKFVHIHFCSVCGTKLYLAFERFPDIYGLYAGTFDQPDWFEIKPDNTKHIFIDMARQETILPPRLHCYSEHAIRNDGTPLEPVIFKEPQVVGGRMTDSGLQRERTVT